MAPKLFTPLKLRSVEIKNRIWVSPMCQYSSTDGYANDWHFVHLGARAVGGAGLVMVEATGVSPEGRITPGDLGIWDDGHVAYLKKIASFIEQNGSVPAIQLAHAGRKASCSSPWDGDEPLLRGAWETVAPSSVPFDDSWPAPREASLRDIDSIVNQFVKGTQRAHAAGFKVVEIHMAHGYLLHSFLSPLANKRTDEFGGSLENRVRLPLRVTAAVRETWPETLPLVVRISATDWAEGGWDLPQSIELSKQLKSLGVDVIDCSTGGLVPHAKIPVGPGFQVPFAEAIRKEAEIATSAVGYITEPLQAEEILAEGRADVVSLARELLRNPNWPLQAAAALGYSLDWPVQYQRAKPRSAP